MQARTHTHVHTNTRHTHMRRHTHTHECMHACTHKGTHTHTHMQVHRHTNMQTRTHRNIHARKLARISAHQYRHEHKHKHACRPAHKHTLWQPATPMSRVPGMNHTFSRVKPHSAFIAYNLNNIIAVSRASRGPERFSAASRSWSSPQCLSSCSFYNGSSALPPAWCPPIPLIRERVMLFVATQWVAAVYAVNHPTSDPPGPRFKWRDATTVSHYRFTYSF